MEEIIKYLEEIKEYQMQTVQLARSTEVYKLADKALKAIKVIHCCTMLNGKKAFTFDNYLKFFYTHERHDKYINKETQCLMNIEEIEQRYKWYLKYL